jgi:ferritin
LQSRKIIVREEESMQASNSLMKRSTTRSRDFTHVTWEKLIELLNEDLAREYQAVSAYDAYSPVLKGETWVKIGEELEAHASDEIIHALTIAEQIYHLGGKAIVLPNPVRAPGNAASQTQR